MTNYTALNENRQRDSAIWHGLVHWQRREEVVRLVFDATTLRPRGFSAGMFHAESLRNIRWTGEQVDVTDEPRLVKLARDR